MRQNLPVTDIERHLRDGDSIVSRTNTLGIITYVNTAFCEISGYRQDELIGQPHNIIRHPDMPAAVFADLWATLKAGKSWRGLIKNRCKDGGFYWVEANANPIFADDEVVGYMSLRTRPTAEQVRRAQRAYADLRDGSRHGRWRLHRGRLVRSGWRGLLARLHQPRIRDRIAVIIAALALTGLLSTGYALSGMASNNAALAQAYNHQLIPSQQLGTIIRKMMENRILMINAAIRATSEPISTLRRQIAANQVDIATLVSSCRARINAPEQQELLDRWNAVRLRYKSSIDAALEALEQGAHERAMNILTNELSQRYQPLVANATALANRQATDAARALRDAEADETRYRAIAMTLLLAATLLAGWLGLMLSRAVMRPLADARRLASAIGSGDLTGAAIIRNDDEIGDIVQATLNIAGNLRGLTRDAIAASNTTIESAFRIADDARDTSLHMVEQKQIVARISSQTGALRQSMDDQLEQTHVARELTSNTVQLTDSSQTALLQVIQSIDDVQQATNRIGDIVTVMTAIAGETDILALNAVERSRAGGQHAAFSLVVDDVRGLAKRSRSAASGARHMMTEIINTLDRCTVSLCACREQLNSISEHATHVSQLMQSNIGGMQANAQGAEAIDAALIQLAHLTADGTDLSMRTTQRAMQLKSSAELLRDRMAFFTLPNHATAIENLPIGNPAVVTSGESADD